ncbi:MAG: rRNA pseudouridine synthase [Candidatus Omnitrophica bacterium]|nr:rRNA pseudouridine synthase [Candidatus Omnitrophota bacterium]
MEQRLQTILAHRGVSSRRGAGALIESGKVKVDGEVVKEKGFRIDSSKHKICVSGKVLRSEEKKHYFLFNKPKNVISTVSDTHSRKTITDFFKKINARLYPVGRLDKDTEGAIVVTNDGDLAHKLMHPSFETKKEYVATSDIFLTKEKQEKLSSGVKIDGKKTCACKIKLLRRSAKGAVYKMILHEGRKRQIKRMFEAVGAKVLELKRVKYAGLELKNLKEGEYRSLTKKEVEKLKKNCTLH